MPNWKNWLLAIRLQITSPIRRLEVSRLARSGSAPLMILFYHRVADDHPNDWTISNQLFQDQMNWIRERYDMVSLAEIQSRIRAGSNDRPAVSITFDDGYADNVSQALPFLIRNHIPCTYFVTLNNILTGEPFPHDAATGIPLDPNTSEQVGYLANAGIEIGAHTRTHPDLGKVRDPIELRDEIAAVKPELEAITGRDVRYFAFPFGLPGNMSQAAFDIALEAGYEGVCSAYGGYNFPGQGEFHMERIHGDAEMLRLKNWLTFDRRKLRKPSFQWNREPSPHEELSCLTT